MNQNIYIIPGDFFETSSTDLSKTKSIIEDNCDSERLLLVHDVMAEDFFIHLLNSDIDLLESTVVSFYSKFRESNKLCNLRWYQLDEVCNFHIDYLTSLLFSLDHEKFGIYLTGCLPLFQHIPHLFLYFFMSPYDIEDTFLLMDSNFYKSNLDFHVNTFNKSLRKEKEKKGRKVLRIEED